MQILWLNTEKLWKYRPYYEASSGKRYYSDWVGLDPTNTSYFEPTVHTYANINVTGNEAQVRGSDRALQCTDGDSIVRMSDGTVRKVMVK